MNARLRPAGIAVLSQYYSLAGADPDEEREVQRVIELGGLSGKAGRAWAEQAVLTGVVDIRPESLHAKPARVPISA